MVKMNDGLNMKLSEYRALYDQFQQLMKEKYGYPILEADDQLLLRLALNTAIDHMKKILKIPEVKEETE